MAFLSRGGTLGALMRDRDWQDSPLGAPADWPQSLKTTVGFLLPAQAQIVLFWGPDYVALYNDAYAPTIGDKHPRALGRPAQENWAELWDDLEPLLRSVRETGETVHAKDRPFYLERHGYGETAYFDISYSAVPDESGGIGGVLCIVAETTERVEALAARTSQLDTLATMFEQAPSFIAMLSGPEHRYVLANKAYKRLVGGREVVGRTVAEAVPEAINQGYGEVLDRVFRTGERFHTENARFMMQPDPTAVGSEVVLDFLFEPVRDARGQVTGIFVQGVDLSDARREATAREQAEADLRASREELQLLTDSLPVLVSYLEGPDAGELRYRFVNRVYEDWFPGGRSGIEGRRVREVLGDEAFQNVLPYAQRALAGETVVFEHFMPYRDARHRHIRVHYIPRTEAGDRVIGIYAFIEDVTEQRAAEAALRQSGEQLRLATEAAEIGLWDVDPVQDTLYWPPRVKRMFGIQDDRPVSMTGDFYPALHPEDAEQVTSAFAAAMDPQLRALYDVEYRAIGRDDGVVRWVAAKGRGVFDESGRCIRVVGTAIDITRRKADEERLRELNETLERRVAEAVAERKLLLDIIDGADVFVQVADRDLTWRAINRAAAEEFARIFGTRKPQAGDNMLALLRDRPEHQEAVRSVWSRALDGEDFVQIDAFGDPALDRRHYEMRFRSLRDPNGDVTGAYQFVSDVTDRISEQERLAAAEEALAQAQKMQAVGQLAGGIAHDFNNLLGAIVGSLDLVLRRDGFDERTTRSLNNALTAARRGSKLTAQLLAFARAQRIELKPVSVSELLERMQDLLVRTLGPTTVLRLDMDAPRVTVLSDETQLEMAVLNLAINARDAMPEGGELVIRKAVRRMDADAELAPGDYVELSVIDTGTGMPESVADRAFDPFFTTKPVGQGTGLGLSQVYGFAHQAGGTARIRSRPGQGTTVSIYLPIARQAFIAEDETGAADPGETGRRATILVVDDDPELRQFLIDGLHELGHHVIAAESGAAGLAQLQHSRPDLMLVDYAMPGMNGVEFAEAARRQLPDVPILFASGYSDAAAIERFAGGTTTVLRKPFGLNELAQAVASRLDDERPA
ncbi:PAS domain-containing protein [Sphingomonas sp. ID1715]|uniref:PAS domain-containing protein n=1 Tax=Sphingomonas sp. ID1715 TaxID=1656898 RepID=UPI001487D19A|nr:PAS domain-containing protein [Sphingomonas sp. ID1715]NNM76872.1 PAS domain-containing protein [Sphingomonas sp. ID1715]